MGNVNNLSWNDTPDDTCRFILSEKAQRLIEEVETFSEVTCPFAQALALLLALVQHSVPANGHPEVFLLPVKQVLLVAFDESSSVSVRASGSSFASGCTYLRFNIEGPAKLKIGTLMPKLAQLAGFNN